MHIVDCTSILFFKMILLPLFVRKFAEIKTLLTSLLAESLKCLEIIDPHGSFDFR